MSDQPDDRLSEGPGAEYRKIRALGEATWLAEAPGARRVVLKALEEDCLLGAQLHPMIRDRLERVRELAVPAVANLHGIRRIDGEALLIWDYCPGQSLEEYLHGSGADGKRSGLGAQSPGEKPAIRNRHDESDPKSVIDNPKLDPLRLRSESSLPIQNPGPSPAAIVAALRQAVADMHARGIVHGDIHEGNVIVAGDGSVRLTHVSPLLYQDPDADVAAVDDLEIRLLGDGAPEEPAVGEDTTTDRRERAMRRRAWMAAVAIALAGAAVAYGLWRLHGAHQPPAEARSVR